MPVNCLTKLVDRGKRDWQLIKGIIVTFKAQEKLPCSRSRALACVFAFDLENESKQKTELALK